MFTSICLLELSHGLLLSHSVSCTSNYYIINENENKIKYSATVDPLVHLSFYYTTPLSSFLVLEDLSYNSLSQLPIFLISSSSSYCFIRKNRLWLTFANGFFFHYCQFSSNFFQYSCLYFLSPHPYNNFTIYFPSVRSWIVVE